MTTIYILLTIIFAIVLVVPFVFKAVEERLEFFLLIAGIASVTASWSWSEELVRHALLDPVAITVAVLVAGSFFRWTRPALGKLLQQGERSLGLPWLSALLLIGLALASSLATALVAALALAESLLLLRLKRSDELRLAILGCYAIGTGAVLTPLGEPLATITLARLQGEPHNPGFWFLAWLLGRWVLPVVIALGLLAFVSLKGSKRAVNRKGTTLKDEGWAALIFRAGKVYVFVLGLELLGAGFNPATGDLLQRMPASGLYWAGMVSAVLDNASLAAAGLSPKMSTEQLRYFMLGMMIAGGMLVPGNFPNIVVAAKLNIGMKEWARVSLPLGAVLMVLTYVALHIF